MQFDVEDLVGTAIPDPDARLTEGSPRNPFPPWNFLEPHQDQSGLAQQVGVAITLLDLAQRVSTAAVCGRDPQRRDRGEQRPDSAQLLAQTRVPLDALIQTVRGERGDGGDGEGGQLEPRLLRIQRAHGEASLGHQDAGFTLRTYAHSTNDALADAAAVLNSITTGAEKKDAK